MSYPKRSDEQHKTEPIGAPPRANRRRGRVRRAVAVAAALAGVALLAAACAGGSPPATAPSAPAGGSTTAGNTDAIAYSQCMRAHGVPTFPDPSTSATGGVLLSMTQSAVSSPDFGSAQQTCRSIDPALVTPASLRSK